MTKIITRRPTQKQIAEKLGLSAATVSLALRNNPVVAQATRDLVQQAMRDTGYVRNIAAASLRTGRSNIVGVSFHTVAHSSYGDLLVSIERAFEESGTVILINNHEGDVEKLDRFISTLATYGADALLVSPPHDTPMEMIERIGKHGMQVLYLGQSVARDEGADTVVVDNRTAGDMAACHLLDAGYDRLRMIGGQTNNTVSRERMEGVRAAVERRGGTWHDDLWTPCPLSQREAVECVGAALDSDSQPNGIVCCGDTVSRVACSVLRERGLEPGGDIGLVGIGSERAAEATVPILTMVCGDTDAMGRLSAEILLARLADPEAETRHVVLDPKLVIGRTSGGPVSASTEARA